jgi:hypothetical protein
MKGAEVRYRHSAFHANHENQDNHHEPQCGNPASFQSPPGIEKPKEGLRLVQVVSHEVDSPGHAGSDPAHCRPELRDRTSEFFRERLRKFLGASSPRWAYNGRGRQRKKAASASKHRSAVIHHRFRFSSVAAAPGAEITKLSVAGSSQDLDALAATIVQRVEQGLDRKAGNSKDLWAHVSNCPLAVRARWKHAPTNTAESLT